MKEFILTQEHLKLLSKAYITWNDCETGAPGIDCKRPYGNSYVEGDIHEILTGAATSVTNEQEEQYIKLHRETLLALQICLCTQSFIAGIYIQTRPYDDTSYKLKL